MRFSLVDLLTIPSERNKQRSVGASDICDPCNRCLADALYGVKNESEYDMGAKVGTAIHLLIESEIEKHHPTFQPETRVVVGHIDGYGPVTSTSDLYIPEERRVCDWKTTVVQGGKMDKLVSDLADWEWLLAHPDIAVDQGSGTALSYLVQTHLYAKGVEDAGNPVDNITIGVIARDGKKIKEHVREVTFPYNPRVPEVWLGRAQALWDWLDKEGGDPETLDSAPNCFVCDMVR